MREMKLQEESQRMEEFSSQIAKADKRLKMEQAQLLKYQAPS